jgi:hypothetical protein
MLIPAPPASSQIVSPGQAHLSAPVIIFPRSYCRVHPFNQVAGRMLDSLELDQPIDYLVIA